MPATLRRSVICDSARGVTTGNQQPLPDFASAPLPRYDWLIPPIPDSRLGRIAYRAERLGRRLHWRVLTVLLLLALPLVYAMLHRHPGATPAPRGLMPKAGAAQNIPSPFAREAMRPLSPSDAKAWNGAAPVVVTSNPAAPAFLQPLSDMTGYQRSMQCMTMAVYYEAANEPSEGQRAVAQVILNRMRHPVYPKSICGVVFEGAERKTGCQFTFACDGSMTRTPSQASWRRAELVASAALAGYVFEPVGMATHYHADYVVPYWAATLDKVATYGAHIFYRWRGRSGQPAAFTGRYAGVEPALPYPNGATPAVEEAITRTDAPVIVADGDRPIILADGKAARGTKARAPQPPAQTQERWVLPRNDAPVGTLIAGREPPVAATP